MLPLPRVVEQPSWRRLVCRTASRPKYISNSFACAHSDQTHPGVQRLGACCAHTNINVGGLPAERETGAGACILEAYRQRRCGSNGLPGEEDKRRSETRGQCFTSAQLNSAQLECTVLTVRGERDPGDSPFTVEHSPLLSLSLSHLESKR